MKTPLDTLVSTWIRASAWEHDMEGHSAFAQALRNCAEQLAPVANEIRDLLERYPPQHPKDCGGTAGRDASTCTCGLASTLERWKASEAKWATIDQDFLAAFESLLETVAEQEKVIRRCIDTMFVGERLSSETLNEYRGQLIAAYEQRERLGHMALIMRRNSAEKGQ